MAGKIEIRLTELGIELPDDDFGYNPTTPRTESLEL